MAYLERIRDSNFDSEIFNWPSFVPATSVNFWLTIARHTHTRAADWQAQWASMDAAFRGADDIRLR